jgi:hypothetical protein
LALDGMLGEDQDQFIVAVDGLINFVAVVVTRDEFMGRKPARNVILPEIRVESLGDGLILVGVADKQGMILIPRGVQTGTLGEDEGISEAAAEQPLEKSRSDILECQFERPLVLLCGQNPLYGQSRHLCTSLSVLEATAVSD